jgi:hypothetical protein
MLVVGQRIKKDGNLENLSQAESDNAVFAWPADT